MEENKRVKKRKRKRRVNKGCLGTLIALLLVILSAIIMFLTPIFNITRVTVSGNSRISSDVILNVSGVKTGDNIFSLNSGRIRKKVSALPYIESVKIVKSYPDRVKIQVTEGVVAAYIENGEKVVGINESGVVLCNTSAYAAETGAPIVTGFTVTKNTMGETVLVKEKADFDIFLKFIRTFKEYGLMDRLTSFDISDNDYIVFWFEDKLKVEFGDTSHFENKFDNLVAIIKSVSENETPDGVINMVSENYTYRNVILKKSE